MKPLFIFLILLGASSCSSVKPYKLENEHPNFIVDVEIEGKFLTLATADLFVQEMRGKCAIFFHGLVDLEEGINEITLPLGRELLMEFARVNATFNYRGERRTEFRFTPVAGYLYRLRARERNGSQELTMEAKGPRDKRFRELQVLPAPDCKKWDYRE